MVYYLKQYRREYGPKVFNFMPPSIIISPRGRQRVFQLDESVSKRTWIVKPSSSSQGRGIRLVTDLNTLDLGKYYSDWRALSTAATTATAAATDAASSTTTELNSEEEPTASPAVAPKTGKRAAPSNKEPRTFIVSQYIDNPYLIRGYKFDLRIYVLVTSFHPMTVYLYREGLVRFATRKYNNDAETVEGGRSRDTMFTHLTNTSINKYNPMFKKKNAPAAEVDATKDTPSADAASQAAQRAAKSREEKRFEREIHAALGYGDLGKRTLRQLWAYFESQGIDYHPIWDQIKRIVNLTLVPLASLVPKTDAKCFELYGFDIMLDENLKPWLIEVNFSPSLGIDTLTDQSIKEPLIEDAIDVLNPIPVDSPATAGPIGSVRNLSSLSFDPASSKTTFPWEQQMPQEHPRVGSFDLIFPFDAKSANAAQKLSDISVPRIPDEFGMTWLQAETTASQPVKTQQLVDAPVNEANDTSATESKDTVLRGGQGSTLPLPQQEIERLLVETIHDRYNANIARGRPW
jgi:hypothetical protein